MIENSSIDPLLLPIVQKLNASGYKTSFSCQGNHPETGETKIAYICFESGVFLPQKMRRFFRQNAWQLDTFWDEKKKPTYAVYAVLSDFSGDAAGLSLKNAAFLKGWSALLQKMP